MATNNYLFVYGTLLNADNEFAIHLKNNCSFYANGKFKGRLYDIGEYPGAIADNQYAGYVYGCIFMMDNVVSALKYLDDYEGFGPEQEQPNLFAREIMSVESEKGIISCWCYLYNLPVDGLRLIVSGDYMRYRNSTL
jgi:gamma-glutamylcyclotransferase (GGCT)/AIG2-like uncharacterized protein YtfP